MFAVTGKDGEVSLGEVDDPVAGSDEILVRVMAAGLNNADLLEAAGGYPPPPGSRVPPGALGLELAGVVEQVGDWVTRFRPGDRVMALVPGGAQAQLAVAHERLAMAVPDNIGFVEAGGFPEAFMTAFDALFDQCGLAAGERLLVLGAAGGVGTAAVQLGVFAGADVVASVRAPGLRERVAKLGATVVAPGEEAELAPYDVVVQLVAPSDITGQLALLAIGGRLILIGFSQDARARGLRGALNLAELMPRRKLLGATLRNRSLEEKATLARRVEKLVLPALGSGRLRVLVEATYPFSDAAAAYERFRQGGKLGKIVLVADDLQQGG